MWLVSRPRTTAGLLRFFYLFKSDPFSDAAVPAEYFFADVVAGAKNWRDHGRVAKAHTRESSL